MRNTSEFTSILVLEKIEINTFREVIKKTENCMSHSKELESTDYQINTKGKKIGNGHKEENDL